MIGWIGIWSQGGKGGREMGEEEVKNQYVLDPYLARSISP